MTARAHQCARVMAAVRADMARDPIRFGSAFAPVAMVAAAGAAAGGVPLPLALPAQREQAVA